MKEKPNLREISDHNYTISQTIEKVVRIVHDEPQFAQLLASISTKILSEWLLFRFRHRKDLGMVEHDITKYWNHIIDDMHSVSVDSPRWSQRQEAVGVFCRWLLSVLKANEAAEFHLLNGGYKAYGHDIHPKAEDIDQLIGDTIKVVLISNHPNKS